MVQKIWMLSRVVPLFLLGAMLMGCTICRQYRFVQGYRGMAEALEKEQVDGFWAGALKAIEHKAEQMLKEMKRMDDLKQKKNRTRF